MTSDLLTFVPPHPNRNAASCANNSPNPNINPLMNGSNRLIAAPRTRPHNVGGEYRIRGELEDDGGDGDKSWFALYDSLSECIVKESERLLRASGGWFAMSDGNSSPML